MNIKKSIAMLAALSIAVMTAACTDESSSSSEALSTTEAATKASATTQAATETTTESNSASVGAKDINILDAAATNTQLSSGSATVTIGNKQVSLIGAYIVDGINATVTGGTYESTATDQNVFLVINGGSLTLTNAKINKTGDAGANDSTRTSDVSDDYNFYGMNSVILVVGEGSSATVKDCEITSDSSGANALFSTAGANVNVDNVSVSTTGNSARGVYATYEGTITAQNISIKTTGAHCAPIATDRGGGYVTVKDSKVESSGDGSPSIYSTGNITVENIIGISTGAQAAVIEGKNSITMTACTFEVSGGNNGVMLYQSMSGDAADSDATSDCSTLTMTDTTINNNTDGAMFYITNTNSVVNINGANTLKSANGELVSAATGRWGNDGSNGGTLTLNIRKMTVADKISADDISTVTVNLSDSAAFTGSTEGSVTVNNA